MRVSLYYLSTCWFTKTANAVHVCYIKFHNSFYSDLKRVDKFIFFFIFLKPTIYSRKKTTKKFKKKRPNVFCAYTSAFFIVVLLKMRRNIMIWTQNQKIICCFLLKFTENIFLFLQKELFLSKLEPDSLNPGERKMSTSSSTSMKTKWLKAFRSLKPAGSGSSGSDKWVRKCFVLYKLWFRY